MFPKNPKQFLFWDAMKIAMFPFWVIFKLKQPVCSFLALAHKIMQISQC